MSRVNPQGCQVFSFKQPSAGELEHDFLWRATCRLPERGRIGVFNRSCYGGRDKRCMMEARLEGHQPIAVTDEADSLDEAIAGAADKLKRSLDHTLSRVNDS